MTAQTSHPFQVMAKPIGPRCNLDCKYCYYLEKERLYPETKRFEMRQDVLEAYIRDYIASQEGMPGDEIWFNWQGGEPTILGVDYFRRIVALQKQYRRSGKRIRNALQTNGTLLDNEWAEFFKAHDFLIGLSLDGPEALHDGYRVDRAGRPSYAAVMEGLSLLKQHGVTFNILTVVHSENARHPKDVYRFLRDIGAEHIQFIPIVERSADGETLASAPQIDEDGVDYSVTPWSVLPRAYGAFLCAVFDEWVRHDVGRIFVQFFDVQLGLAMGAPSSLCWFSETCGQGLAIEHNGDIYACDHYVYPEYRLGNILTTPIGALAASEEQLQFGLAKRDSLPSVCRTCDIRFACQGGCPKHRFLKTSDGKLGLNYYCRSMKQFMKHAGPCLQAMSRLIRSGRPASDIMVEMTKGTVASASGGTSVVKVGRNDPCPCGSGKKFKACCG
ncbi:anaerobic sulfatase maturase [uncultured Cohaesibacter sp.]|uniref:anaerobic sulfatase maturase n=1 Tax=uncultured Cohaesibacter sp. TaxID=1002546 RepID=UPI002AA74BB3|nr:anaerobic sulfatase maturase [uncultured Cohaesibacter sp.]